MRAIRKKMQSQRGASITFALLLFLVCAVLSAVIVVASTTSAGRMSRLPETDQRYFAVTSAAELLKDLMKEPVTFIEKSTTTDLTTQVITIDGASTSIDPPNTVSTTTKEYYLNDARISPNDISLQGDNLDSIIFPYSCAYLADDAAYRCAAGKSVTRNLSLSASGSGAESNYTALGVTIREEQKKQRLTFTLDCSGYTLKLVFDAETDIQPTQTVKDETKTSETPAEDGTTKRTITREIVRKDETRTTVTWKLSSIQTSLTPTA